VDQFDSELWLPDPGARTAAELRILLYLDLVQQDPKRPMELNPDANTPPSNFPTLAWGVGQAQGAPALSTATDNWGDFKRKVVSIANTFWDKRMWLRPPLGCTALRVGKWAPNVLCRFHCALADNTHPAHIRIKCWRLFQHSDKDLFRPDVHLYHNFMVETAHPVLLQPIPGVILTQQTVDQPRVAHEIGHAIGLHHSAESVAGCGGDQEQYGLCKAALPWMAFNIMGAGSDLYVPFNAGPWLRRAQAHTRCNNPSAGAGPGDTLTGLSSWQASIIDTDTGFTDHGVVWDT
jgi:hypothetical protein